MKIVERGTPLPKASKALILLHGRGGSAEDILTLAKNFEIPECYIVAPEATHNIWYPYSFMAEDDLNEPDLSVAVSSIKSLIDEITKYIPTTSLFIMGFSQGACLTLEIAARFATQYGGIVAFTGGLIGHEIEPAKYKGSFQGTPIFMSNGDHDPHIPLTRSLESQKLLEKMGAQVRFKIYKGRPHLILEEEIAYVKRYIFQD